MTGRSDVGAVADLRHRYVEQLRRAGVLDRPGLAEAFAHVPRELFLADGFHGRDGARTTATDPAFLPAVYSDEALVTKLRDGTPVSSSSQPSLMATMIDALDPVPGARVLEIGAGTGYNAALLATLGAVVTSLDVQPDVVARAGAALTRAGLDRVRVRLAD
ncbi:protein-L-isoaspartate O-methyltransferase, partial [Micromonospora zhanjiangensis]